MGLTYAIFSIAVILSLLGATTAFLITYEEYEHHYPDRRKVLKTALKNNRFYSRFLSCFRIVVSHNVAGLVLMRKLEAVIQIILLSKHRIRLIIFKTVMI
jgi:hypothetical protein